MQIFIEQLKQIGFGTETYFSGACVHARAHRKIIKSNKNAAGAERAGPGCRNTPLSSKRPWIHLTVAHAGVLISGYIFCFIVNT